MQFFTGILWISFVQLREGFVLVGATEDFFKLDVGGLMPLVVEVLGVHAYVLRRYGLLPGEEVSSAVAKLKAAAPHLAEFLREAASLR